MRHFSVAPIFQVLGATYLHRVLIYAYTDRYYMPAAQEKKLDEERDGRWAMRKLSPLVNKIVEWLEAQDVVCEYWPDQNTISPIDRIKEQSRMRQVDWDAILVFAPEPKDALRFAVRFRDWTDKMYLEFPKEPPTPTAMREMLWLLRDQGDALLRRFFIMRRAQRTSTTLCFEEACPICFAKTRNEKTPRQVPDSERLSWQDRCEDHTDSVWLSPTVER